jgi:hypothetical protein
MNIDDFIMVFPWLFHAEKVPLQANFLSGRKEKEQAEQVTFSPLKNGLWVFPHNPNSSSGFIEVPQFHISKFHPILLGMVSPRTGSQKELSPNDSADFPWRCKATFFGAIYGNLHRE